MASPPPGVLAAIALVSGRIVCVERCGAIPVRYDAGRDLPTNCHPYADCPNHLHPDSPAAVALSEYTFERLADLVAMADYGEPAPLNVWEAAP
jgi:hypothetical protein